MSQDNKNITKGSLLVNNTFYFLLSQVIPLLVAIFSIPLLINGLGVERFGVLTIVWMVTGYYSLFDFGVGRALTKMVSERLGAGNVQEIPALVWTALFFVLLMGLVGTLLVSAISPYLAREVLQIPPEMQTETLNVLYLLAVSIPIVISATSLRGVLEAYQRFAVISIIRTPVGMLTFLSPLLVLPFSQNIFHIVAALLVVRIVEWLAYLLICFRVIPSLRNDIAPQRTLLRPLISTGGWMTVSNIVGPTMLYLDRFLISGIISLSAVAYYTTPYEVLNRLMIIPGALVGVLFPAFSHSFEHDRNHTTMMFFRGVKYTFIAMFPVILVVITLAYEGLELWLGSEFAQNSTSVLQLLAIGALFNSITYIPYALVQAGGRSDLTAKLHFIEFPFYLLAIWWLTSNYGIEGAAFAWALRLAVDALILYGMAQRLLNINLLNIKVISFAIGVIFFLLVSAALPADMTLKSLFLLMTILAFVLVAWFKMLSSDERLVVHNYINAKVTLISKGK
jgi:O-antigen/teichoic acid export membrane protein